MLTARTLADGLVVPPAGEDPGARNARAAATPAVSTWAALAPRLMPSESAAAPVAASADSGTPPAAHYGARLHLAAECLCGVGVTFGAGATQPCLEAGLDGHRGRAP